MRYIISLTKYGTQQEDIGRQLYQSIWAFNQMLGQRLDDEFVTVNYQEVVAECIHAYSQSAHDRLFNLQTIPHFNMLIYSDKVTAMQAEQARAFLRQEVFYFALKFFDLIERNLVFPDITYELVPETATITTVVLLVAKPSDYA